MTLQFDPIVLVRSGNIDDGIWNKWRITEQGKLALRDGLSLFKGAYEHFTSQGFCIIPQHEYNIIAYIKRSNSNLAILNHFIAVYLEYKFEI